jgi:lipopolysaccharide export LptBFGC system permease protein LptF
MNQLLWGMLAMAALVAALLFLRLWRTGRDRLFLFFAAAFALLALNWLGLGVSNPEQETLHYAYVLRLGAFVLIIVGIVDKNRRVRDGR